MALLMEGFPRLATWIAFTSLSWFSFINNINEEQFESLSNPKRKLHPDKLFLPNGTETSLALEQKPLLVVFHSISPSVEAAFAYMKKDRIEYASENFQNISKQFCAIKHDEYIFAKPYTH